MSTPDSSDPWWASLLGATLLFIGLLICAGIYNTLS